MTATSNRRNKNDTSVKSCTKVVAKEPAHNEQKSGMFCRPESQLKSSPKVIRPFRSEELPVRDTVVKLTNSKDNLCLLGSVLSLLEADEMQALYGGRTQKEVEEERIE